MSAQPSTPNHNGEAAPPRRGIYYPHLESSVPLIPDPSPSSTPHPPIRPTPKGGVKITSWNVNDISELVRYIDEEKPDVLLLLDAKCKTFDKVPGSAKNLFNESYKKSPDWGTKIAFFSKVSPIFVQRGFDWLGHAAHEEWTARCIVAEFENTYLVGTYVHCGSGAGDHASDTFAKVKRESWVVAFSAFMTSLVSRARSEKKGIIWTGDLSACVDPELDKEPYGTGSYKKITVDVQGLGPEYALKAQLDRLELTDAWRSSHDAKEIDYSWINTSGSKNHSSARIDHFMLSSDLLDYVEECELRPLRNKSSDHRPITLVLSKRL